MNYFKRTYANTITFSALLFCCLSVVVTNAEIVKRLTFKTPEHAAETLKAALKDNDNSALLDIFGHEYDTEINTSDKAAEKVRRSEFYEEMVEGYKLDKKSADHVVLLIGKEDWPFSIPLVKNDKGWLFDTAAGIDEVINRRIGHNELAAIAACDAILDAQLEYIKMDHDNDGVLEFARKFKSTPGDRDGLYWASPKGAAQSELSPLERFVSDAGDYLEARQSSDDPYKGYYYRILFSQGENAAGGKYNYVVNNNMIAGFAVIAWPAEYDNTGIMTFMMSHEGTILEKDLGENTATIVANIKSIDPDNSWQPVSITHE